MNLRETTLAGSLHSYPTTLLSFLQIRLYFLVDVLTVFLIALGLSMDAFAVAVSSGIAARQVKVIDALKIALFFGGFQAIMPTIGWLAGIGLRSFISGFDHWLAFGLLTIIGLHMIYESTRKERGEKRIDPTNIAVLFVLAVATSIDALAVGLSLSLLKISIIMPVIIIGGVTFALSLAGVFVGNKLGHFFEKKIEVLGGLILIAIGIRILVEHLR